MLKWFTLFLFVVGATSVLAHEGGHGEEEVDPATNSLFYRTEQTNFYGANHGGYGFLSPVTNQGSGAGSEAEARDSLEFSCRAEDQRNYLRDCGVTIDANQNVSNFITEQAENLVLQRFRDQAAEYLRINYQQAQRLAGNTSEDDLALTPPDCIDETGDLWTRAPELESNDELAGIIDDDDEFITTDGQREADKEVSIRNMMDGHNMAQALLLNDTYSKKSTSLKCNSGTNQNRTYCPSINYNQYRLQQSFPALWRTSTMRQQYSGPANFNGMIGGSAIEAPGTQALQNTINQLMGAHNAAAGTTIAQAQTLGQQKRTAFENGSFSREFPKMAKAFEKALKAARKSDASDLMKTALENYENAVERVQTDHATEMKRQLDNLCVNETADSQNTRAGNSLIALAVYHPHIIRQGLLDMPENARNLAKTVLCQSGVLPNISRARNCHGVTASGGPTRYPQRAQINRRVVENYPFGSDNNMEISRQSEDDPYTITMDVNIVVGNSLDSSGNLNDKTICQVRSWHQDINAWLNCSVGQGTGSDNGRWMPTENGPRDPTCDESPLEEDASGNMPMTSPDYPRERVSCPNPNDPNMVRVPGMKFNIRLNPISQDQAKEIERDVKAGRRRPVSTVNLHKCFRAEVSGDDQDKGNCDNVETWNVNRCITRNNAKYQFCIDNPNQDVNGNPSADEPAHTDAFCKARVENYCKTRIGTRMTNNPHGLFRANAGNYTMGEKFSTVRHEVVHLLGVADEYRDSFYPFNHLGEHSSIMSSSNGLNKRLYPRHLDQILDPMMCSQGFAQ